MFEDNEAYSGSIKTLLDSTDDILFLKSFLHAKNAYREVVNHKPDVVLMDIDMPQIDGITALFALKEKKPELKVLMLTSFLDEHKIFSAICAGASGYVLKGDVDNIEQAIYDVMNGGGHFSASIAMRVIKMLNHPLVTKQNNYTPLTKREQEVLQKMYEGCNRKMAAAALGISEQTISDYYKTIYQKLHVNSAQEAVREAILRKLV